MYKNEVNIAFEILLEEIEEVFNRLNQETEEVIKLQNYEKARELIEQGERLKIFREKVRNLQQEWQTFFSKKFISFTKKRKIRKKLKRGLRTPENEFMIPVLESLIELGGRGKMKEVLAKVYEKMKDKLNEYDLSSLESNPRQKRWENTAQWARNTMVNRGLLSSSSPRGIWEITEKGRQYYEKNKKR